MHHQHNIFREGDRALNISSGLAWAEMIVKYTRSPDINPNVVTVSQKETKPVKGTYFVKGDMSEL